ncbi:UDP-Glc:alpha-D-GlcNAc-diphosphoundecaprenol beta-1,3-glucosyltransferase WfgD [Pigmentiphaga humi]|uniref:UDP-Glc:alpha-D-GlcNAc-diphosphoundecaprenol beta-1,3-glucosyltransferase WfgD n=1 Tax=Pigmentiphaga humi TaxID=2478468 RepID=A0A3P4B7I7_9BURK|nr:glycosyltransferase family A protein [Pigmentiphaga humi]VCU71115.1 UDP-Glc:alpha-D-GlcNAc-diphosphoundecaprenol beta-1,3-glucosyltransferase WfgD [Pigmentiphaga humi]
MKSSVIVPAYNAEAYLAEALSSALEQLADGDEIIVVDDASTDGTAEAVRQLPDKRIRYQRLPRNTGAAGARNAGLAMAQGELIQFLDSDDLWPPGRQATILAALQAMPQASIVAGQVEHFHSPEMAADARRRYVLPATQAAMLVGSTVMRRGLLDRVGHFDASLASGEFVDLMSRSLAAGAVCARSEALFLRRRIHGNNHTLSASGSRDYLAVVRAHLERKRGQP